jgi:hypothetical protein
MHTGLSMSGGMYAAFAECALIEPVEIKVDLNDREQVKLVDYYTIGEERLAQLSGKQLERLHKAGFLRAAYFLVSSLQNIGQLIELKNRRLAAG